LESCNWLDTFLKDIITKAFQASNCGYEIDWKRIYSKHEGTPLKTLLFLAITSFRKEKRLLPNLD
jgi:hypothetical protein